MHSLFPPLTVFALSIVVSLLSPIGDAHSQELKVQGNNSPPLVEKYLQKGKLRKGEADLQQHLLDNPNDDQARFGLGVLQFIQSAEHLGVNVRKFAPTERFDQLPFIRMPVEASRHPKEVTYEQFRNVLSEMISFLEKADNTLSQVKSKDVKLPLHLFTLHLDFDRDGKCSKSENLTNIFELYLGLESQFETVKGDVEQVKKAEAAKQNLVVTFDYSDVLWLRGYSQALRAICEFVLAHDEKACWNVIAHRVFKKGQTEFDFLAEEPRQHGQGLFSGNMNEILDLVAAFHNLNFKVLAPERLKKSHSHLKQMVSLSREMWSSIQAETDDENEWIPNTTQKSAVSLTRINPAMVKAWSELLDEVDLILEGKKLLPFCRGTDKTRGVNLKKVFYEPTNFDLLLWIQGSGAAPFLEKGDVTNPKTWSRFRAVFGGDLYSFAAWFN